MVKEENKSPALEVEKLTAQQLYAKIKQYPENTWTESPERYELQRRLNDLDLKTLDSSGYWIPCWKLNLNETMEKPTKKNK